MKVYHVDRVTYVTCLFLFCYQIDIYVTCLFHIVVYMFLRAVSVRYGDRGTST